MAIHWISKKLRNIDKESFIFTDGNITSYMVGIQAFESKYKDQSHHKLRDFGIVLTVSKLNSTQINVELSQILKDKSNNSLYRDQSWVQVVVIACLDSSDSNLVFNNFNLTQHTGIFLADVNDGIQVDRTGTFLRSFSASFGTDQNINLVGASSSAEAQQSNALLAANCLIQKEEKEISVCKALEINLIAMTTPEDVGIAMRTIQVSSEGTSGAKGNNIGEVKFDFEVGKAVAFITSFEMKYGPGVQHNIGTIMAGASYWNGSSYNLEPATENGPNPALKIEGNKVRLVSNAGMYEMSSSTTIKNQSASNKVTYLILATKKEL